MTVGARAVVPAWAHYRKADDLLRSCGSCSFFDVEEQACTMFRMAPVEPQMVCDRWSDGEEDAEPSYRARPEDRYAILTPDDITALANSADALEPRQVGKSALAEPPKASGIAVRAKDSGRVLMLQRANAEGDPAAGCWELPGGRLNDGEHPYLGAKREWQEEMGVRLPRGEHVGSWRSGVYQGFIHEVPSEDSVRLNVDGEDRRVANPDPDGDNAEVSAWFHPEQLKRMSALRPELRQSRPWVKLAKSAGALYLVAHAKTKFNRPGQKHDIVHGWLNPPLDPQGRREAAKLGRFLHGAGVDTIHSSDLKRAKETAEVISKTCGTRAQSSRRYRPWNLGSFAGHSSADVIPRLKPYMGAKAGQPVDGGESFDTFKGRFLPALERLLKQAEAGKTIALVTHSRNIELAQGWLGGKDYRTSVDPAAISSDNLDPATVFRLTQGSGGKWRMAELTDETVKKGQAHAAEMNLRVHGISRTPSGQRVYRMVTRDGHYIGRTSPTNRRARKGDVLKVQANDLLQDAQGDLRWMNAAVIGGYSDAPHSWRELEAMAGGALAKDTAPGPAGDLPPAGDEGTEGFPNRRTLDELEPAAAAGSGPTVTQVHVNVPLRNISQAYAPVRTKRRGKPVLRGEFLPITKGQAMKQLVYGVVLEPNSFDSQDDFMLPHHVERSAHNYLKKAVQGKSSVVKLQHRKQGFFRNKPSICPVESFIAPVDFAVEGLDEMVKKGSWVMCMHVEDPELWQDFLDGKYTGFSVGGTGVRQSLHMPTNLVDHDLIGREEPNYFAPDPRKFLSPANG